MDIQDRIICSDEEMMLELNHSLERMNSLRYDNKIRKGLGDAFVQKLDNWESLIKKRKDDPFTVVVVGDFKRGKSTLINALLGEKVVTTNVTTETVTMNRIRYGLHSNEGILADNRRVQLKDSELSRDALEHVFAQLDDRITTIEMKRSNELLKTITIIDTPGTGDALQDFSALVNESLLQADAVIFVFNVRYPLSLNEQMFLRSSVVPQKHTALFLVGNFVDTLDSEQDYASVRNALVEKAATILSGADVYLVSALDELRLRTGKTGAEFALSETARKQFTQLREDLNAKIEEKQESVLLDRMQRLTEAMVRDLTDDLSAMRKGLSMNKEDAANALAALKQEQQKSVEKQAELLEFIDTQVDFMKNETKLWMTEFIDRMAAETSAVAEESVDTLRKYYELYCIDLMQAAMETCVALHQNKLYDFLEQVSSELSQKVSFGMENIQVYDFQCHLDNRIWTKGDTVGLVTSMLPVGGLLMTMASLAADGISGLLREREIKDKKPDFIQQIDANLLRLPVVMSGAVDKVYLSLCEKAKALIVDYGNAKIEESSERLNKAVLVAAKENEEKEEVREAIDFADEIIRKMSDIFASEVV